MRGPIAAAFGMGENDLSVRERGFRGDGERLTHVCSVADGPTGAAIFLGLVDESTGDATIWRATGAGDLVSTVRFLGGQAMQATSAQPQTSFISEKDYMIRQMRAQSFRLDPAPPHEPSPHASPEVIVRSGQDKRLLPSEWLIFLFRPWSLAGVAIVFALALFNPHRD
ncbi:MAG TPA: hypothetical protein VGF73_11440 [Chthoniobacterales bacterium]|jgi:hypothetical protein